MDIVSQKMVKARKEHKCDYCGRSIGKGEQYESSFIADGGESWIWKACPECVRFVREFDVQGNDWGINSDDISEAAQWLCEGRGIMVDADGIMDTENNSLHDIIVKLLEVGR